MRSGFGTCQLGLVETNPPELSPTCDPSTSGLRPAPATLQGPSSLIYKTDTPKRLSSDEKLLHNSKVALLLSGRYSPVCFLLLFPVPFFWCDIPSLPSLAFSISPELPGNLLSFYYYPFSLPSCPAVLQSTLQLLSGQVEGLASEGSKERQRGPDCGPQDLKGPSCNSHLSQVSAV